jgi:hypothetical protein
MAPRGKKTTMAKLNREAKLRERRLRPPTRRWAPAGEQPERATDLDRLSEIAAARSNLHLRLVPGAG